MRTKNDDADFVCEVHKRFTPIYRPLHVAFRSPRKLRDIGTASHDVIITERSWVWIIDLYWAARLSWKIRHTLRAHWVKRTMSTSFVLRRISMANRSCASSRRGS